MNIEQERAAFEAWHERLYGRRPVRKGEGYAATAHTDRWMTWIASRAAVEADRQEHLRDAAKMVPSDEELLALLQTCGVLTTAAGVRAIRCALSRYSSGQPAAKMVPSDEEIVQLFAAVVGNTEDGARFLDLERDHAIRIARALLSRYSIGQPAASAEPVKVLAHRIKRTSDLPGTSWIDGAPSPDETGKEVWSDGYLELAYAAPVAQEPVGEVFTLEPLDGSGDVRSHALLTKPLPAGTQLFAALVAAQPTIKDSLTVQPAQDREDAERYREFFAAGLPITFLGADYRDKPSLDAAIDAARAAKVADHA
jgi:hypothetical protein